MDMRPLGTTGLRVSVLGLGTVKLGRDRGVRYPHPFTIPDDAAAAHLLDTANGLGINFLDTAPAYGTSESRLGHLLRGRRDRWIIATKAGEEFDDGESRFDFSPRAIRASVERSLIRLGTDRVEIVLIHSDGLAELAMESLGTLDALRSLKVEGKIRAFGVSTKTLPGAQLAVETCDCVMVTLNPQSLQDLPAIAAAREKGIGVLIKKALAGGHMAGQSPESCLRLAMNTPGVSSVILGTTSPGHLVENAAAAERVAEEGRPSRSGDAD